MSDDEPDWIQEVRDTFESAAIEAWKKANAALQAKVDRRDTALLRISNLGNGYPATLSQAVEIARAAIKQEGD